MWGLTLPTVRSGGRRFRSHTKYQKTYPLFNAIHCTCLLLIVYLSTCRLDAVHIHIQSPSQGAFISTILLPVQIPSLLQDPQNIPRSSIRPFGFATGGQLTVNLEFRSNPISSSNGLQRERKFVPTSALSDPRLPQARQHHVPPFSQSGLPWVGGRDGVPTIGMLNAVLFSIPTSLVKVTKGFLLILEALGGGVAHVLVRSGIRDVADDVLFGPFTLLGQGTPESQEQKHITTELFFTRSLGSIMTVGNAKSEDVMRIGAMSARQDDTTELSTSSSIPDREILQGSAFTGISVISCKSRDCRPVNGSEPMDKHWLEKIIDRPPGVDPTSSTAMRRSLGEKSQQSESEQSKQLYILLMTESQWNNLMKDLSSPASYIFERGKSKAFSSYLKSVLRVPVISGHLEFTYTVPFADYYRLILLNPTSDAIQLQGTIDLINPGPNHLSTSDFMDAYAADSMYFLNILTTLGLALLLLTLWRDTPGSDLRALMGINFAVKSLYLILDSYNVATFVDNGALENIYWILPKMICKIQDIITLVIFLLIALGWKVHRLHLSLLETRALAGVCVLSFYLGVFEASIGALQAIRYIVHSLAYLVVIVAINFNIALLDRMVMGMGLSKATAKTYQQREGYEALRIIFIIFILKPTILLFYKLAILEDSGEEDWILMIIDNLLDWGIMVSVVYSFRPTKNFRLFEDLRIGAQDHGVPEPDEGMNGEDNVDIDHLPHEDEGDATAIDTAASDTETTVRRSPGGEARL